MGFYHRWPIWLLGVAAFLLWGCTGASSSFFRTTYTSVSEPGEGLPQFAAVGYVDDRPIARYETDMKLLQRQISWMKKVAEEDPQCWMKYTQTVKDDEDGLKEDLVILQNRYNQTEGLHTWQMMVGCEVSRDRSKGAYLQFGYDGRDLLSLGMETLTWTAAEAEAQMTKRQWEADPYIVHRFKAFIQDTCMEWFQGKLDYGEEGLRRREPPTVKVMNKVDHDSMETLVCRVHGFYPKEINATWRKDGEIVEHDTFRGVVAPNSDGTYYIWLSIRIEPKDWDLYWCHVEHDALPKPLDVALEEPASNMVLIIGWIMVAVLLLAVIAGISGHIQKRRDGKEAASIGKYLFSFRKVHRRHRKESD